MKNKLSFLALLLILLSCHSGKEIEDTKSNLNQSWLSYWDKINRGELEIINGDYASAKKYYEESLKNERFVFSDNLYNGLQISIELGDTLFGIKNAEKLIQLGICEEFFSANDFLKTIYEYANKEIKSTNKAYRYALEEMFNADQEIRQSGGTRALRNKVDSLNFVRFQELVIAYGYPTDQKIGIDCSTNNKGISPPLHHILMTHFSQHRYEEVLKILKKALSEGEINPYHFSDYRYLYDIHDSYPNPIVRIGSQYYRYKLSEAQRNKANQLRRSIGMSSIEEQINKIEYSLENDRGFRFFTPINNFPDSLFPDSLMNELFERYDRFDRFSRTD